MCVCVCVCVCVCAFALTFCSLSAHSDHCADTARYFVTDSWIVASILTVASLLALLTVYKFAPVDKETAAAEATLGLASHDGGGGDEQATLHRCVCVREREERMGVHMESAKEQERERMQCRKCGRDTP